MDNTTATVTKVTGSVIKGGFRFTATLADGTTEVVRAKATRPYRFASQYAGKVATGKSGLAACFAYSEKAVPGKGWGNQLPIATFAIEWSDEDRASVGF